MMRRLLGSLRGVGAVHAGDVLLRTTAYDSIALGGRPAVRRTPRFGRYHRRPYRHHRNPGSRRPRGSGDAHPDNRGRPPHGIPAHEQRRSDFGPRLVALNRSPCSRLDSRIRQFRRTPDLRGPVPSVQVGRPSRRTRGCTRPACPPSRPSTGRLWRSSGTSDLGPGR